MQWEKELFEDFQATIPLNPFMDGGEDSIIWKYDSSGSFPIKSFTLQVYRLMNGDSQVISVANKLWLGIAPPRAEILAWFVLQERLNTKEKLCLLGILQPLEAVCPFCLLAWKCWAECLTWWGFSWCCPPNPKDFFDAWNGLPVFGLEKKLWTTLFHVVVWSLWNIKNRIVFQKVSPVWELEICQMKMRWGFWVKKLAARQECIC